MCLGVAHARTFTLWPSGGLQNFDFEFGVGGGGDGEARTASRAADVCFALAWMVSGLYWVHFSMHDDWWFANGVVGVGHRWFVVPFGELLRAGGVVVAAVFTQRNASDYGLFCRCCGWRRSWRVVMSFLAVFRG